MPEDSVPVPAWLLSPVSNLHRPPVRTKQQTLPFDELDPEDFERLCVRLAQEDGDPEACRLYGKRGQAQGGIDLYARLASGRYATYQCKRYETVKPSDITNAVRTFRRGKWLKRSDRFVFCTSRTAVVTSLAEVIEREAKRLKSDEVAFEVWDAEELSERLKSMPRLVLDFFGRPWIDEFCTTSLRDVDTYRLDAAEMAALRAKLHHFYERMFVRQDPLGGDAAAPMDRFVEPDVMRARHLPQYGETGAAPDFRRLGTGERDERPPPSLLGSVDMLVQERIGATSWFETNRRTLLIGGAGTGKSTLLRWLCLELLASTPQVAGPAGRAGAFLAVWLPFGRWVGRIADGDKELSLPGALERFFESYAARDLWQLVDAGLRDGRLILLVDGLDEWSDQTAAEIAADRLQQYLAQRSIPALACGRLEGLRALGVRDPEWATAEFAPLTPGQQVELLRGLGASTVHARSLLARAQADPHIRPLSFNPLLLGLLWRLADAGIALPRDRHAVFARFVQWLIRTHAPARRRAAELSNPLKLADDEVESALAELALIAQSTAAPALHAAEARDALVSILRESDGADLPPAEARQQTRVLIDQARGPIGLLSEVEGHQLVFAHRALQEHLAARALTRLSPFRQREMVAAHAITPGWRNVMEGLIGMAPSSDEASALIQAIAESPRKPADRWMVMPLLAQIAMAPNLVPTEDRQAALAAACEFVGTDDRLGPRGDTLDLLLANLDWPAAQPVLTQHLPHWFPSRAEDRSPLLDATHTWPTEPETVELWWRGLSDEHTRTGRKAAALLVHHQGGDDAAGERLAAMLRRPISAHSRATVLEAMSHGWPDHPELNGWIGTAREGADPDLRLVAIDHIVRQGDQTDAELDLILSLADGWTEIDFDRRNQVGDVLIAGWPTQDRIRDAALVTVDDNQRARPMEITLATWILLYAYSDEEDVVAWVKRALKSQHPFVTLGTSAWKLVGENFKGHPAIVSGLEEHFVLDDRAHEPDLCEAALGLRTPAAKRYLLDLLHRADGWPSAGWPFGTLVEGWSGDPEVLAALQAFVRSGNAQLPQVASWISKVVPEAEANEVLLRLVSDPTNDRAAMALDALAERTDPDVRRQAVVTALPRRAERPVIGPPIVDVLLAGFSEQPDILAIALEELQNPDANLRPIALAAKHLAQLRGPVRSLAVPLPGVLRRRLTQRLFELSGQKAAELSTSWIFEHDGMTAAAAASARAVLVPSSERENLAREATDALHARKLDRESRGQAGLCALLELRKVKRFAEQQFHFGDPPRDLWVEFGTLQPNWWMASRVAAHFHDIRTVLGDDLERRFNTRDHPHSFWSALAPFATGLPDVQEATLEFIRREGIKGSPQLLQFLATVRPGSRELRQNLLESVSGSMHGGGARATHVLSAELIAEHFSRDDEVFHALHQAARDHPSEGHLLALALGWSHEQLTQEVFARARQSRAEVSMDVWVRLRLTLASADQAVDALCRWLRYSEAQTRFLASPTSVTVRRTTVDPDFAQALSQHVRACPRPSEQGSGARLLSAAGRLDEETRTVMLERCEMGLCGKGVDLIGLDIFAEELRPLGWTLWDALYGSVPTMSG